KVLRGSSETCVRGPDRLPVPALPPAAGARGGRPHGRDRGRLPLREGPLLRDPLPQPDLVIYLEARPEVLLRRLRKRDRDFERGITHEYLERLTEAFRSYFHAYTEAPLLVVNCSDIDFVEHGGDLADLIKEIRGSKLGVQHYIPLGSR